jgi:maltose/moltooligosaccharide transporter
VVGNMLPWLLARAGVSNHAGADGAGIPDTVRYAFEIGAGVLLGAILWTILRSREYPPEELLEFEDANPAGAAAAVDPRRERRRGLAWALSALVAIALIRLYALDRQLYLVCGGALLWGAAQWLHGRGVRAVAMWIYTTAAVAQVHFGSTDPHSDAFNNGALWVGVLFAAYNGFAALAAAVIPFMVRRLGLRLSHLVNVWLGAAALLSFLLIRDPHWLLLSMVGMGFAWASVLSLPYALLSDSVPAQKMGLYMGVFNFFIVIPQLVAASVLGFLLRVLFGGAPIYALVLGGASFLVAGLLVLRVPQPGAAATGASLGSA